MKLRRLFLGLFLSLALVVTFIPMIAFGEEGEMHELVIEGDYQVKYDEYDDAYAEFSYGKLWTYYNHDEGMFAAWEGDEVSLYIEPEYGWNVKSVQYSLDGQTYSPADFDDKYETYYFKLPVRSGPLNYDDVFIKVEFKNIIHGITITDAMSAYDSEDDCYYADLGNGAVYGLSYYNEDEDEYYGYDEDTEEFVGLAGQDIDLWVEPDEGYFVDSFDCYTDDGDVDVEKDFYDNSFYFEMPDEDVTIDIGIEKKNEFSDLDDIISTAEDIEVGDDLLPVNSNGADENPKAEGLFRFVAPADGTYVFYSDNSDTGANPVGQVLFEAEDNNFYIYAEHDDNSYEDKNFCIYFDAEEGEVLYLQAITFGGDKSFNIGVKASDVKSIAFTPVSQHYCYGSCLLDFDDWEMPWFEDGDKITVTKKNNSTATYVYVSGEEAFVNVNNRKDVLSGGAYISVAEDAWSAPLSEHAVGSTMTAPFIIGAAGQEVSKTFVVKFAIEHYGMNEHEAEPPSCYWEGNTAYWHCWNCDKYFADEAGTKEIAEDSWIIPPAHSWAWEITTPAGFLKNGSKIQHCTECGEYGSTAVVPGYAKYFVKGLKVKKGKKSFTVKLKKQSKKNLKQFNGYQIMYSTKADMSGAKTVNASKKAKTKKIKGLKKKTTYYVKVCSFTKKGGVTYYSKWSPVKKVKTK